MGRHAGRPAWGRGAVLAVLLGLGSGSAVAAAPEFLASLLGGADAARPAPQGPAPADFGFPLCTSAAPRGLDKAARTSLARQASVIGRPLSMPAPPQSAPQPEGGPPAIDGVRTYYVGIDEVEWNYAPRGIDGLTGLPFTPAQQLYVYNAPDRIGAKNMKVVYREYTDATFKTLKPDNGAWAHLGLVGPVLRGVVGETIKVVAHNSTTRPYSLHPHGVFYDKASEGAHYADGETGPKGIVAPGQTYTYTWRVPERAGPGPADGSSVAWPYHSHDHEGSDENTGLVGVMVITARGKARPDGRPIDVDREFVTLYKIFDENMSELFDDNLLRYTEPGAVAVGPSGDSDGAQAQGPVADFVESNLKHSINGYLFGNVPGLVMYEGEHVRWYVVGMGSTNDMHTAHWHGNTVLVSGRRMDTIGVFPATSVVADMVPDNVGTWMMHCHVIDHFQAGMTATYTVLPRPGGGTAAP